MSELEHLECPFCYEKIKYGALKCRHCHAMLDGGIDEIKNGNDTPEEKTENPCSNKEVFSYDNWGKIISIPESEQENSDVAFHGKCTLSADQPSRPQNVKHVLFDESEIGRITGKPLIQPSPFTEGAGCIPAILFILGIFTFIGDAIIAGLMFFVIAAFVYYYSNEGNQQRYEKLKEERKTEAKQMIFYPLAKKITEQNGVPKNAVQLQCFKGLHHIAEDMQNRQPPIKPNENNVWIWLWKDNEALMYTYNITNYNTYLNSSSFYYDSMGEIQNKFLDNFFDGLPFFKIKSDDILFYAREGDFYIKTDVKGSGGGTDYGNAVVGGLLFGGAGAVVASRQEVKVDTTTTEVDKRDTRLYYNYNNKIVDAHFDSGAYDIFRNLFPNKDEKVIDRLAKLGSEKTNIGTHTVKITEEGKESKSMEDDVYIKLEKLSALKEKGIITEEDFSEKKKKLLDQL